MKINKNKIFEKLKKTSLFISIFYITLYIPLMFTIYSQNWYEFNYNSQDTYQTIGEIKASNATLNLIRFFSYQENLNQNWNTKEKNHMSDVKYIYTINHILAIISLIFIIILYNKKEIIKNSKINIYTILGLIILIPVFSIFWNLIFHSIMFTNNDWIINPNDISYYLFPIEFFRNSLILIIISAIIINIIINKSFKKLI